MPRFPCGAAAFGRPCRNHKGIEYPPDVESPDSIGDIADEDVHPESDGNDDPDIGTRSISMAEQRTADRHAPPYTMGVCTRCSTGFMRPVAASPLW